MRPQFALCVGSADPAHGVIASRRLKNVFQAAKPELNGSFLRYTGEKMPW